MKPERQQTQEAVKVESLGRLLQELTAVLVAQASVRPEHKAALVQALNEFKKAAGLTVLLLLAACSTPPPVKHVLPVPPANKSTTKSSTPKDFTITNFLFEFTVPAQQAPYAVYWIEETMEAGKTNWVEQLTVRVPGLPPTNGIGIYRGGARWTNSP